MAKLTKAQKQELQSILNGLVAVRSYVLKPSTVIAHAGTINAKVEQGSEFRAAKPFETKDYVGRDDSRWSIDFIRTLEPVEKEIGSPMASLAPSIAALQRFLEE